MVTQSIQITKNFTLNELIFTGTGYLNVPDVPVAINLTLLCVNVLQPLRDMCNLPIYINSGYRSKLVNDEVGGTPNSQHLRGKAADISCSRLLDLYTLYVDDLDFDQCILYLSKSGVPLYMHISFNNLNNRNFKWSTTVG